MTAQSQIAHALEAVDISSAASFLYFWVELRFHSSAKRKKKEKESKKGKKWRSANLKGASKKIFLETILEFTSVI